MSVERIAMVVTVLLVPGSLVALSAMAIAALCAMGVSELLHVVPRDEKEPA